MGLTLLFTYVPHIFLNISQGLVQHCGKLKSQQTDQKPLQNLDVKLPAKKDKQLLAICLALPGGKSWLQHKTPSRCAIQMECAC